MRTMFQIGWYNDVVETPFNLKYSHDTLAFILVSTPSMFEASFIPYLREHGDTYTRDPLDECMASITGQAVKVGA